jgi:hypothetical protein
MKQTAVEWLLNELDYETICKFDKQLVQAKEMEKEQIIDAFGIGCQVESTRLIGYHGMAEQLYRETYGE